MLFYNLEGSSFSNNLQVQLNYEFAKGAEVRFAYKNYDVKVDYLKGRLQKALLPEHRFFANLSYETTPTLKGAQWRFDYTFNWLGEQRLPFTASNPIEDRLEEYAPSYSLMNAQVARVFSDKFEIYVGGENLTGFTQENPILASENPFGPNFDTSIVYAPILRSMYYAGLRFKIK